MKKNTLAEALERYGIYDGCKFRIVESGLNPYSFIDGKVVNCFGEESWLLAWEIITGEVDVTVLPWEPKLGDEYWFLSWSGEPRRDVWRGFFTDYERRKVGSCTRTEEELLSRKDEIMREIGMITTIDEA